MSVKPLKPSNLYPLAELERVHCVLHHQHVKNVVDSVGPQFSSHIPFCDDSGDLQREPSPIPRPRRQNNDIDPRFSPARSARTFLPVTLASIAGRVYPPLRMGQGIVFHNFFSLFGSIIIISLIPSFYELN